VPESFFDAEKGEVKGADFRKQFDELMAFKAADDVRRASVPAEDAYRLELPKDFKLPEGMGEWKWNENDPVLKTARTVANKLGIDQNGFSELLSLHVAARVGEAQAIKNAFDAELKKLGPSATARVTAVQTWLKAMGGEKFDALNRVLTLAPVAGTVEALEDLIKKFTSQGGTGFSQSGRDGGSPDKVSDEQWSKMSFSERLAYADKHKSKAA
jgi:hypothetical protein